MKQFSYLGKNLYNRRTEPGEEKPKMLYKYCPKGNDVDYNVEFCFYEPLRKESKTSS